MTVAFFSENFHPEISGIADAIVDLGQVLAKRGHQIIYVVPRYSAENYHLAKLEPQEINLHPNIRIIRLPSLPFPAGTGQARLVIPTGRAWWALRKLKPDIIHTQHFFGVGLEALIAAKMLNVPLIGTNHTVISEFIRYSPVQLPGATTAGLHYVSWYYNRCQYVTAPSATLLSEMVAYGLSRPHEFISNPIDTITFHAANEDQKQIQKKEFGFSSHTLLYVGRFAAEKKIEDLIMALPAIIAQIPDTILALAGHGQTFAAIQELVKKIKLETHVKFLGTLDKPTLARAYQAAEIFAIASTSENQPMTLLQAYACSIPAVGVRARGLAEHIHPELGKLVEPGNIAALSTTLIDFLSNAPERQTLGAAALAYAQHYNAESIATVWEERYASMMTPRLGGPRETL